MSTNNGNNRRNHSALLGIEGRSGVKLDFERPVKTNPSFPELCSLHFIEVVKVVFSH